MGMLASFIVQFKYTEQLELQTWRNWEIEVLSNSVDIDTDVYLIISAQT
jgi:hypothetical protein